MCTAPLCMRVNIMNVLGVSRQNRKGKRKSINNVLYYNRTGNVFVVGYGSIHLSLIK